MFSLQKRSKSAFICMVAIAQFIVCHAQQDVRSKSNEEIVQKLLDDKENSFDDLLQAKPEAVANAKKIYTLTSDPQLKQRIASILLSIGIKEQGYREYLERAARVALGDTTPWPTQYNDKNQKSWNPAFLDWCKKLGLNPTPTLEKTYYEIPMPWYFVGAAGDPTFYNLLVEGLHSQNQMIVILAAKGLAKLQDFRAIEALISVGQQSSGEARFGVGQSLLYFKQPKAQAAAKEFMSSIDDKEFAVFRKQAQEEGVKGLFGW